MWTERATDTIFGAKRLISHNFSDTRVQSDLKHWPFMVMPGAGGTAIIEVEYKGETMQFKAKDISSMVLTKMREITEAYLSKEVKNDVVTVISATCRGRQRWTLEPLVRTRRMRRRTSSSLTSEAARLEFNVDSIPPTPHDCPQIDFCVDTDANSICLPGRSPLDRAEDDDLCLQKLRHPFDHQWMIQLHTTN